MKFISKHNTNASKKTPKLSVLLQGIVVVLGLTAINANAFLTDTSRQKVILIGKGGAENMQAVKVQEIRSTQPVQTVQQPQYTQQPQQYTQYNSQYNTQQYNTQSYPQSTASTTPQSNYAQTYTQSYGNPTNVNAYGGDFERLAVSTNSAAVAVFDVGTGRTIYEKNVDRTRSIASITKMMTAMVVLDSGQDLRDELTISSSDLVGAKSASTRLKAGDKLSRSEFMLMMLMKSENPAAKTLASHYHSGYSAFIDAMNQKAQSLGMYDTRFSDASGLNPRNVSTANDLVKMMREIGTNPRYQTIRNFSTAPSYDFYITNYNLGNRTYSAGNTNSLVRSGNYPIGASKTGFIREAGHCVVMETHINGRPAIIVLLGANGSQNRWNDAENIMGQLAYRN